MNKIILLFSLILCLNTNLFANGLFIGKVNLKGTTSSENIIVKCESTGDSIITNSEGYFEISLPAGKQKLKFHKNINGEFYQFSLMCDIFDNEILYKEFTTQYKPTTKSELITTSDSETSDIVVVGYGTGRKAHVTGAIATVTPRTKEEHEIEEPILYDKTASDVLEIVDDVVFIEEEADEADEVFELASTSSDTRKGGKLTAAEVNDFAKWKIWPKNIKGELGTYSKVYSMYPKNRFVLQLTTPKQMPLPNAEVKLLKNNQPVWASRTDNTGKAELWTNFFTDSQPTANDRYTIQCDYQGKTKTINAIDFEQGINCVTFDVTCPDVQDVDIMFIIDATGSMYDEIKYLQNEFVDVIQQIQKQNESLNIHTGSVFYRDYGDDYISRVLPLSEDFKATWEYISNQEADGGGDYEEAIPEAIESAIRYGKWRENTLAKIAFLVLDAPCHNDSTTLVKLHENITKASQMGIRIVPIVCSDVKNDGEYLMRSIALATNGTSFFLTDDSGIGNTHHKPSTDEIKVEKLNDMLIRTVLEFTKIPECENEKWSTENIKPDDIDQFVPNPYEMSDIDLLNDDERIGIEKKDGGNTQKLSIQEIIKVAPNPCSTQFTVSVNKDISDMFLADVTGKIIQRLGKHGQNEPVVINVSGYASGIYFLKILYQGGWYTHKEIIKGW